MARIRIWDLPTRLFHWFLVIGIGGSWATAELGEDLGVELIDWHARIGYAILTLILFRLVWGVIGGRYARFADFVCGPRAALAYMRGAAASTPGHNPLGAFSVLALLLAVAVQASTGLFANDDVAFEGPLAKWVSRAAGEWLTSIHHANFNVLLGLVALHLAAIAWYRLVRRERLVEAMIWGDRELPPALKDSPPTADDARTRLVALAVLLACALAVAWLVTR